MATGTVQAPAPRKPHAGLAWSLGILGLLAFAADWLTITAGPTAADLAAHSWMVDHRTGALTAAAVAISTIFGTIVLSGIVAVTAGAFYWCGHQRSAVLLIGAMAVSLVVCTVLKYMVQRARPPVAQQAGPPETDYSFPSGHTISTAVFFLVAGYLWWRLKPVVARLVVWVSVTAAGTAVVACTRVYLGVHYLSDVLASMCLAIAILGLTMGMDRWTWWWNPPWPGGNRGSYLPNRRSRST